MSRRSMAVSAGLGSFVGFVDVFLGERRIELDGPIWALAKFISAVLSICLDNSRIKHDGVTLADSIDELPIRVAGGVERQETACTQEAVDRFDRGDKGEAEDVMAQRSAVLTLEPAQRDEIDRHIALDRPARDHSAMRSNRRHMNKAALRQRAFSLAFGLVLVVLGKDLKRGIVERRIVLRRPLEFTHVPRADYRLDDARQLGLRLTRIPNSENERSRRESGDWGRVATDKTIERFLCGAWQIERVAFRRSDDGVAKAVASLK